MDRHTLWIGALVFALTLAGPGSFSAQEAAAPEPDAAAEMEAEAEAVEEAPPYWVLEEFDWGDDEEVVAESVEFDPNFMCKGTPQRRCVLVSTEVAGELLLARFHHHEGGLWQVAILTPDLDPAQAEEHLGRVWELLVGYVTQKIGEPQVAFPLPDHTAVRFGTPQLTHFWSVPGLEARVAVGRRDVDSFYLALFFSDPVRGPLAREVYEARVAASDAKRREQRREGLERKQRERQRQERGAGS